MGIVLPNLINLTSLYINFKRNNIESEGCEVISDGLSKLTNLTSLNLDLRYN